MAWPDDLQLSCFTGYDWYLWKERTARSEMSLMWWGHAHQKRATRPQVCAMPLQLLTYLQEHQRPHRLSQAQLPASHQFSALGATPTAHPYCAGHVSSHLRSLSWQLSGNWLFKIIDEYRNYELFFCLQFNTLNNALARCPHCRKVSSVGSDYARNRCLLFMFLFFIMTAIAIGVTAGTARFAPEKSGLYALYIGKFCKEKKYKEKIFLKHFCSLFL